jgi:hypothetical protein
VETQFVRQPLMIFRRNGSRNFASVDTHDDRAPGRIEHTRPWQPGHRPLIDRHAVVREISRPEKATNVFNFGLTDERLSRGLGEWRDLSSFQIAFPFLATPPSGLAGLK